MAPRPFFLPRMFAMIAALAVAFPLPRVSAASFGPASPELPALTEFAQALTNGQITQLRGAYAPGRFADRVVQQPVGDATFVSPRQHVLTEFSEASRLGSTGLLAHNYLSGAAVGNLGTGQSVYLVYGDGGYQRYTVTTVYRFQAIQPENVRSDFIDLENGGRLSAAAVFTRIYFRPGDLVFQTCISVDGNDAWGRLFVIAEPSPYRPSKTSLAGE